MHNLKPAFDLVDFVAEHKHQTATDPRGVGRAIATLCPVELQPEAAKQLGYVAGMTADGPGWRHYNPRETQRTGTAIAILRRLYGVTQVLMQERYNSQRDGDTANNWEIPGGGLKQWEPLVECAMREAREETGLDVHITDLIGHCSRNVPLEYTDGEERHCVVTVYAAEALGGELKTNHEALNFKWIDLKDMLTIPQLPLHAELAKLVVAWHAQDLVPMRAPILA